MRVSRLLLVTLRDDPAEAEIPSHKLLLRAGYIRRVSSGIYAYLPLLWRVLQKVAAIVRDELAATGALETLLPQLQPAELWQRSGRWAGYTAGEGIMFHLEDRQGRELGLGPTHEEVITVLAADLLRSYRQLPVTLYQIQTKFRDEIRPRFGLMRGREFIMKDAYSFHADEASLQAAYGAMDQAYRRIFARCGLRAVAVEADSGAIGGSASQEFMVTAEAGEDLILASPDGRYAANQERAVSLPAEPIPLPDPPGGAGPAQLETPGRSSIEALCSGHGFDPSQIVKVLLLLARFADGSVQPLLVSLRGDQQLNDVKLTNAVAARAPQQAGSVLEIAPLDAERCRAWKLDLDPAEIPFGFLGPDLADALLCGGAASPAGSAAGAPAPVTPHRHAFLRLADATATTLPRFVCGANALDRHRVGVSWSDLGGAPESVDLRTAQAGDRCVHDPGQTLTAARGIEVGHIFQLGRKYSTALQATVLDEGGKPVVMYMGCYGIGVTRIVAAAIEQNHDAAGIIWPEPLAPFTVVLVPLNAQKSPRVLELAERLYGELQAAGVDVLFDDRDARPGVKFADAELLGIPHRVVISDRGIEAGKLEYRHRRASANEDWPMDEVVQRLLAAHHSMAWKGSRS